MAVTALPPRRAQGYREMMDKPAAKDKPSRNQAPGSGAKAAPRKRAPRIPYTKAEIEENHTEQSIWKDCQDLIQMLVFSPRLPD